MQERIKQKSKNKWKNKRNIKWDQMERTEGKKKKKAAIKQAKEQMSERWANKQREKKTHKWEQKGTETKGQPK